MHLFVPARYKYDSRKDEKITKSYQLHDNILEKRLRECFQDKKVRNLLNCHISSKKKFLQVFLTHQIKSSQIYEAVSAYF